MVGEACKSIEDDLIKLGNDFPEWKEETNDIIKEVKAGVGKNGKMKTRGNKHAERITKVIEKILEKEIKIMKEGDKKIEINIKDDITYKPTIDLHFLINNKGKELHIFLEYKRWMKDSNQIRSAILNSLLIKEYGKKSGYENSYFYLIGGGVDSAYEIKEETDAISQLILWAEDKEYLKAYSTRELNKLIKDIKNKLKI